MIVKFKASTYSSQVDQLVISSNDPTSPSCIFSFEVGIMWDSNISDPSSCNNIITASNSFGYLFRDTLILSSTGMVNWELDMSNNANGFLDITGNPIVPPLTFGTTTSMGPPLEFVFYRMPNEIFDVDFKGTVMDNIMWRHMYNTFYNSNIITVGYNHSSYHLNVCGCDHYTIEV